MKKIIAFFLHLLIVIPVCAVSFTIAIYLAVASLGIGYKTCPSFKTWVDATGLSAVFNVNPEFSNQETSNEEPSTDSVSGDVTSEDGFWIELENSGM